MQRTPKNSFAAHPKCIFSTTSMHRFNFHHNFMKKSRKIFIKIFICSPHLTMTPFFSFLLKTLTHSRLHSKNICNIFYTVQNKVALDCFCCLNNPYIVICSPNFSNLFKFATFGKVCKHLPHTIHIFSPLDGTDA